MTVELSTKKSIPLPERKDGRAARDLDGDVRGFRDALERKRSQSPGAQSAKEAQAGDGGSSPTDAEPSFKPLNPSGPGAIRSEKPPMDPEEDKQLKEACQGFESLFLNYMFAQMRKVSFKPKGVEESFGKEQYQDFFDQELCKIMAKRGMGLGDMLYRQVTHDPQKVYRPPYQGKLQFIK
jgi:hypothetical protein